MSYVPWFVSRAICWLTVVIALGIPAITHAAQPDQPAVSWPKNEQGCVLLGKNMEYVAEAFEEQANKDRAEVDAFAKAHQAEMLLDPTQRNAEFKDSVKKLADEIDARSRALVEKAVASNIARLHRTCDGDAKACTFDDVAGAELLLRNMIESIAPEVWVDQVPPDALGWSVYQSCKQVLKGDNPAAGKLRS